MEWGGALGDGANCLAFFAAGDVKPSENVVRYSDSWLNMLGNDATYRYTYTVAPTVTTDPPTDEEDTSGIAHGTLDDDAGETCQCGFEYGETIAYGNTTPTEGKTTGQTFAQTITGLHGNTLYHVRAFAQSSIDIGYGADQVFTTDPEIDGLKEEQPEGEFTLVFAGDVNWDRIGQLLTIPNRVVKAVYFKTKRVGAPSGTITFTIRKTSDDSIIVSKVWGNAGDVELYANWIHVAWDTPIRINEQVRILMEWSGAFGDGANYLEWWAAGDVKPAETATRYYGTYNQPAWDATYIYSYRRPVPPGVPPGTQLLISE